MTPATGCAETRQRIAILSGPDLSRRVREFARGRPLHAAPCWSAQALTENRGRPTTLRRAEALNAVLAQCELPVWPGELLVGLGNPLRFLPAGALSSAEQERAAAVCNEIGQRHFGTHADHHAPDYPALLRDGFDGLRAAVIRARRRRRNPERLAFLDSVEIALQGASVFMRRWAARLAAAALEFPEHAVLLQAQAERMAHLAGGPPRDFADTLQLVYSYHTMMQLDQRYAMAFGRLDQFLYPFYRRDLEAGTLCADGAQTLFDHLFAKITVDGDVQNIALGGVQPETGADATNDLSLMILEACRRIGLPGGNCTARIHRHSPDAFLQKCAEVIRSGIGYPAVFNDEVQIPALTALGYPLNEARDYCFVGCIEVFIPGRMAPWSDSRFNTLRCVDRALRRGRDGLTGQRTGPDTGEPATWEAFYGAFRRQLQHGLRQHVRTLNQQRRDTERRAAEFTSPLMSALVQDCLGRARDVNDHGARHPANIGTAIMGIGSVADALAAVRLGVYEQRRFSLEHLRRMLDADFAGFEAERLWLLNALPKYGNDDDRVDEIARRVVLDAGAELLRHRNPQGGGHWGLLGANVSNIYAGAELGATADGRRAGQPLSDAASPSFGRDRGGPSVSLRSIAKLPYRVCPGGNVVNVKLHPSLLTGERGLAALATLIRTCFQLGGIQLQFNTTDRRVLLAAMARPEDYRDLVVRVSGFSAHFTALGREVQEDILARTEHRRI